MLKTGNILKTVSTVKNRPVQPKNRKNRKLNRFWPVGGFLIFFIFFYFTLRRFVQNENLTLKVPKPKLTLSSVTPHFSPHLQLQAQTLKTHTAARLKREAVKLALLASVKLSRCSPQSASVSTAARSAQRRALHSCSPQPASVSTATRSLLCSDLLALLSAQQHR